MSDHLVEIHINAQGRVIMRYAGGKCVDVTDTRGKKLYSSQAAQAQAGDGEAVGKVYYTGRGFLDVDWFTSDIPDDALLYAAPPAAAVNQQLLEALKSCEQCLTFIHGGEPLRTDIPLQLARAAIAAAQEVGK